VSIENLRLALKRVKGARFRSHPHSERKGELHMGEKWKKENFHLPPSHLGEKETGVAWSLV